MMLSVFVSVFPANLPRRVIVRGSRLCFVLFPELNGHLASGVVFGDVKERVAAVDRCDGLNMNQEFIFGQVPKVQIISADKKNRSMAGLGWSRTACRALDGRAYCHCLGKAPAQINIPATLRGM
ncbi:hypothetical protein [Pseudomonas syringae]|uniref:hypothetical protein n=1 Tax=Pseudomonas syringae TaxID=317 RepID=UPI0012AD72F8|nr:hypothetical protein [Pseudomonas syringae]